MESFYNPIESVKEYVYQKTYNKEGSYKIYLKDEMSNIKEVTLTTNKLDQTIPTIEITSNHLQEEVELTLKLKMKNQGYQDMR